jgi:hypothetical protein
MVRLGRALALVVVLLLVGTTAALTLPDRLDGPVERPSPNDRCTYFYTAIDTGAVEADDRETATPYAELDPVRQTAFDLRLERGTGAIQVERPLWLQLYSYNETVHFLVYEGRLYRSDTTFEGCRLWEALANESR